MQYILKSGSASLTLEAGNGLFCRALENSVTGYKWESGKLCPLVTVPTFDFSAAAMTVRVYTDDRAGLSDTATVTEFCFESAGKKVFVTHRAYDDTPFFTLSVSLEGTFGGIAEEKTAETATGNENRPQKPKNTDLPDLLFACPIRQKHLTANTVVLQDVTDANNILVRESETVPYTRSRFESKGQMLLVNAYLDGEGVMMVKEAPSFAGRVADVPYDFRIEAGNRLAAFGMGADFSEPRDYTPDMTLYAVSVGVGKSGELLRAWRDYFRHDTAAAVREGLVCMSNTWGDRNQDAAVCEPFMMKEIECAKRLGIRAVQIDDGWQQGISVNSKLSKGGVWGGGFYAQTPDFWMPHTTKFPNTFVPLVESTKEGNIKFGLWFSPDKTDFYAQWERDAQTLIGLHNRFGVRFFKLDGITIENKTAEENLMKMVRRVHKATNGAVTFNFDITASRRYGYLFHREYGTLFVENRYTDWGNYYPHSTLRTAWMLSKYVPLSRVQLEFLNIRRNAEKYAADPLAPQLYEMDYVFAAVLFANPLCWMEMQNLPAADADTLARITAVWSPLAKELAKADVTPLGNEPNGITFTGLRADCGQYGYAVLFRENTAQTEYTFTDFAPAKLETLYNGRAEVTLTENGVKLTGEPRSFVFVKYTK